MRQIAKELNVSEGTAYRAIKEAENKGLVSTIERVGTIRIERKQKENFENLTFAEIVSIVDGQVLGGRDGLYKTLNKFVIGAMELDAMMRYTEKDSLLIVGNRPEAHQLALKEGAAVLITGGFDTDDYTKQLADEKQLPIISTSYDTFTVAAMINRAIYDQLIKKEIILVGDIYTNVDETYFLRTKDFVEKWHQWEQKTTHSRYPVLDDNNKVVGIVTSKDVIGKSRDMPIDKVMTKNPLTVMKETSLAYAAHMMVWEGIEIMPVVDQHHQLLGLISRQDVLKGLQHVQKQPQVGETIDDIISNYFEQLPSESQHTMYRAEITPQMTNQFGTLSYGVFVSYVIEAARRMLRQMKKGDLVLEHINVYFIKPIQLETMVTFLPTIVDIGRKSVKVDVEAYHEKKVVGKAMLVAQLIDR